MKILLINHFPLTGSGSGVYTKNIADSLIKKGHEVCIIFPENIEVPSIQDNIKMHPVYFNGGNKIKGEIPFNFPCFTTHPRSTQTYYDLKEEELQLYIETFKNALEEEIKDFKPDVIHAGHIWILPSIAAEYNIPLIITAHGTDLIGYKESEKFRKYAEKAAKHADSIITISEENSELVKKYFPFAKEKTQLIPNGYNSDVFYPENVNKEEFLKQLGINKNYKNIISFAGKFTYFKGIDTLLKAAQIYETEDTLTLLAGDGELFDEMNELAKKLKLKNVVFLRNRPHNTLRKLYSIADVSLIPSRNEAFGLVVIEALACGAPVIGTNSGGIPDIINKEVGLLIEEDNYEELATKIKDILNKKINFNRNTCAKYAKEKYSQDNFTNILVEIYENGIKNNKIKE